MLPEGKTAINPQTGQRIVWQGGGWKPLGATGIMSDTKVDQESLEQARARARKSLETAQAAERFVDLNKKQGTGGVIGLPGVSGLAANFSPEIAEMESITSAIAPGLRPPGSGASTDKDVQFYKRSFPNVDFQGPANQQIAERLQAESDRNAAFASFMDTWFARNGTLLGADRAFTEFWSRRQGNGRVPPPPTPETPPAAQGQPQGEWKVLGVRQR